MPSNEMRADWADAGLRTFQSLTRTDDCDLVADFLCNLMHWSKINSEDFKAALDRAESNFTAELEEAEEGGEFDSDDLFNCCTGGVAPDWSRYSGLEISGCINDAEEGAEETLIVGRIPRDQAEFFSIYGRMNDGEAEAITDCDTLEKAQAVAGRLAAMSGLPVETIC